MTTIQERVATLEADSQWIKDSLEELHDKMDVHTSVISPQGAVVITISKKDLVRIGLVPVVGGGGIIAGIIAIIEILSK